MQSPRVKLLLALIIGLSGIVFAASDTEITNARVVEMTKLGLGDDIIIARIKTSPTKFALGDQDLAQLKQDGVSDRVIAAMLEASVLTEPRVLIEGKPAVLHTLGQAKVGGRLGSSFTFGIKSVKQKAYLQGEHAPVVAGPTVVIELELPRTDSIDDYIVVKMDRKSDRREIEVGSGGGVVGAKSGIRAEAIQDMQVEELGGNRFRLRPRSRLKPGEYFVYVIGSADAIKGIHGRGYDFTVE